VKTNVLKRTRKMGVTKAKIFSPALQPIEIQRHCQCTETDFFCFFVICLLQRAEVHSRNKKNTKANHSSVKVESVVLPSFRVLEFVMEKLKAFNYIC